MTTFTRNALLLVLTLAVAATVQAQPGGPGAQPSGPAELIRRANEGRTQGELKRAVETGEAAAERAAGQAAPQGDAQAAQPGEGAAPSQPDAPQAAPENPHVGGHGTDPHAALQPPSTPSAEPASDLPGGTIAVEVLDPRGEPYPNAEIVLGVMGSMGSRSEQRAKADASGRHRFEGLAVGNQQAYRVNVLYGGAKFSSTPFRLPEGTGYRVRVPLKATTQDARMVFQVIGQTVVELRDDRLHVTQQARVANAGDSVYVLPKDGTLVPLPKGFMAFQWQDQMTDQRAEPVEGQGFRLRGSLPPGSVTLAWTFDLPRAGSSAKIPVELPFRTFTYRIISEAPAGLTLRAADFPEPERVKDQGRELLFTQVQRGPSEPQLSSFTIKLDGIPTPGPARWIASALAVVLVFWGLWRALKPGDDVEERRAAIAERKRLLLDAAKHTEAEHARGEIGPEFKARRMDEIVTELALLLRDEDALPPAPKR